MKNKLYSLLLVASTLSLRAAEPPANPPSPQLLAALNSVPAPAKPTPLPALSPNEAERVFTAGEFSLDLFGTYHDARPDLLAGSLKGGDYGAGIAANYFFHKNAGLQLDSTVADVENIAGGLFDHTSLSLLVRYPLGQIAPYAIAGAGRDWNEHSFTTHTGAGLEWRFTKHLGAIGEARWTFGTQDQPDTLQFRAGLRYTF